MRGSKVLKHMLLASAILMASGAGSVAFSQTRAESANINVPSQNLGRALMTLSSISGRNVLFEPEVVANKQSVAVRDARSFEQALSTMLAGTGLRSRVAADGSATIEGPAFASDQDAVILEEIVVTADRPNSFGADLVQVGTFRNARVIDAPLTINIATRQLMDAQAAVSLYDVLRNTAGVSRSETNGGTFDSLLIRGIQVDNRNSYKLNGVLPLINLVGLPLENKERVEVLKGVGALYYGFAPPSGIVNLVTERADRNVTAFGSSINEYGGNEAFVDIGRRLSDTFGLRFNGAVGDVENGIDNYDGERSLATLAADWQATQALAFKLDVEYIAKNATEPGSVTLLPAASPLAPPVVANRITLPPIPDNSVNLGGQNLSTDAEATNVLLRSDLRLSPSLAVTLEGGQSLMTRDRKFSSIRDYDIRPGLPSTGLGTLRVTRTEDQRYRNRHVRTELAGAFSTGPVVNNLIIGASVNWRYQNGRTSTPVLVPQNYFNPVNIDVPDPTEFTVSPNYIRDTGIYAMNRAELGKFQLITGLRYSDYNSRTTSAAGAVTEFDLSRVTPSIGIVYKPIETMSFYGTYLEGLEEVSPAPNFSANPGAVLSPATSEQYEIGMKGEVLTGIVYQIAGFRIERPSAFVDPTDQIYKLAGLAQYQGIEASITGEVTPSISVYLTGQYLDAELRSAPQAALVGRTPENTPEWTASLFAEYRPPSLSGLAIGAGLFYVSERPVNTLNQAYIDGYTTYSASLAYTFETVGQGLTVQLTGDNLTDEDYWAGAGGNVLATGVPRQVKLTLRFAL